jgi:AGCS family alanine or glycine:cation symporter
MVQLIKAKLAWDIGDLGVGLMAWFNIIIILLQNQLYCLERFKSKKKEERSCL